MPIRLGWGMLMRYFIIIFIMVTVYIVSMPMPVSSGTDPGDWSGTWRIWTQQPGVVSGGWTPIAIIQLEEIKRPDAYYGHSYVVQGSYEGGRIDSHEPTQSTRVFGTWHHSSPGSSFWESLKILSSVPISEGSIDLEKKWPGYGDLQDKMLQGDDSTIRPYTGADFCWGKIEVFDDDYREIWGFREQKLEIPMGSGTGGQAGPGIGAQTGPSAGTQAGSGTGTQTGSGTETLTESETSTQTGSGISPRTGPGAGTQTGSTTSTQTVHGSGSQSSLEISTPEGTAALNPGERIELTPGQTAEIDAKCDELKYTLLLIFATEAIEFTDERMWLPKGNAYLLMVSFNILKAACDSLKSGKPIILQKAAESSDAYSSTDDYPIEIGLELQEGAIRPEVASQLVAMTITTPTAIVSTKGATAFGLAYDPASQKSLISAYQYPVEVQPANSDLAPFSLGPGQSVEVSRYYIGSVKPSDQPATGIDGGGSGYIGPDGTDIYGPTGGEETSGGCYTDPITGQITCVDNFGNPSGPGSGGAGDEQGGSADIADS